MPHYQPVTIYQAKDGTQFSTETGVKEYITDTLCARLEVMVNNVFDALPVDQQLTHKQKTNLIMGLVGTHERAEQLKEMLDKLLDIEDNI